MTPVASSVAVASISPMSSELPPVSDKMSTKVPWQAI